MKIYLYDSMDALPKDDGSHVLVFTGNGSLLQASVGDTVTEILCNFRIGDTSVQFARNGDAGNIRFEQAFSWAVKYAAAQSIDRVYGVYELDRPLDRNHMNRIIAGGVIDKRKHGKYDDESTAAAPLLCPNCSGVLLGTPVEFETGLSPV